jgi:hypothetical protein
MKPAAIWGAAGVVDAQEQHARIEVGSRRFEAHERPQAIICQTLDQDRNPGRDRSIRQDQIERLGHEALDRLDVDLAVPSPFERDGGLVNLDSLVDRELDAIQVERLHVGRGHFGRS